MDWTGSRFAALFVHLSVDIVVEPLSIGVLSGIVEEPLCRSTHECIKYLIKHNKMSVLMSS